MPIQFDEESLAILEKLISSENYTFSELGDIAELDPEIDYISSDLRGVDFTGSDLTGYNFTDTDLRGTIGLPSADEAAKIGLILTDAKLA